jgi:hypothetical protein
MQMIDVIKRLAQLDATNPAIDTGAAVVKPVQGVSLSECGPMGMMDGMGGMSQPHSPASINMTAATGDELSGMLKDIMSLAGINKAEPEQTGIDVEPMMALTAEPEIGPDAGAGPGATDGEVMRSVLDKLNPEDGEEETPFGSEQGSDDGVSQSHGDVDNDGDHDMADHNAEKSEPEAGPDTSEKDDKEETDETYDGPQYSTTPNDPNKDRQGYAQNGIGPAKDENSADAGRGRHTTQPQGNPSAFESLMKEYKSFIGESEEVEEEDDMGEAVDKSQVPAYKRKEQGGDWKMSTKDLEDEKTKSPTSSAGLARKKAELGMSEESNDILKLAGLK